MQQGLRTRPDGDADGFTLIELMVVVMILAVLIAIAIPSFLGFRNSAQVSAAKAALNTAEKVATTVMLEEEGFPATGVLLVLLPLKEPSIDWLDHQTSSTGPDQISVDQDAGGDELAMATMSDSGTCFYQRLDVAAPAVKHRVDDAGSCVAHDFQDGAGSGW